MVEPTHLKNMLVKLDHFPKFQVKIIQVFELPPARKLSDPFKNPLQIVTCGSKTPPWASWGSFPSASSSSMAATTRKRRQKMVQPLRQGWDEVMACNKNVTKMWLMRYVQFLQTSEHIIHKPWYRNRKRAINLARGESPWAENLRNSLVLVFWQRETSPRNLQSCQLKVSRAISFFWCAGAQTTLLGSEHHAALYVGSCWNTNWQRAAIPFGRQGNMGSLRLKSTHVL